MGFSIIIPIYNVEQYLDTCLQSVVSQLSNNDELILIDDGSTDNSLAIARRYISENIKIVSKTNEGLSSARNVGMRMATKDYLMFVDSDDWIEEGSLEKIRREISKLDNDIYLLNTRIVYTQNTKIISPKIEFLNNKIAYLPPAAWDKIYRRRFVQECDIEFPFGMAFEDVPFTYELLIKAQCVRKLDIIFINWRQRENSISRSSTFKKYNLDVLRNINKLKDRNVTFFTEKPHQLLLIISKKGLLDNLRRWAASKQKNTHLIEKIVNHTIIEAGGLINILSVLSLKHKLLLIFLLLRYRYAKFVK